MELLLAFVFFILRRIVLFSFFWGLGVRAARTSSMILNRKNHRLRNAMSFRLRTPR